MRRTGPAGIFTYVDKKTRAQRRRKKGEKEARIHSVQKKNKEKNRVVSLGSIYYFHDARLNIFEKSKKQQIKSTDYF